MESSSVREPEVQTNEGEERNDVLRDEPLSVAPQSGVHPCEPQWGARKVEQHGTEGGTLARDGLYARAEELLLSGCFEWDLRTNSFWASDGVYRVTGIEREILDSNPPIVMQRIHPDDGDVIAAAICKVLEERKSLGPLVFRFLPLAGALRFLWVHGDVVRDDRGNVVRISGVIQDVTEQKHLDERVHESQRMEAVGRLAGGVAHDFNNMLGPILGYGDMLATELCDARLRQFAECIVRSAQRAADLAGKLLSFARKGKYMVVPVDMHAIILDVVATAATEPERHIHINTQLHAEQSRVQGDPTQLHSVLFNLVLNALDAMPEGGDLLVSTRVIDAARLQNLDLGIESNSAAHLAIVVSDTGVGMNESVMKLMFDPFFSTKPKGKGTGMGLALAYGVVRSHGGVIAAKSALGHGSVFTVYLPLCSLQREADSTPSPRSHDERRIRIMVVDDEDDVRDVVSEMLVSKGFVVTCFSNGQDALTTYVRDPSEYDVILLDMVMPGMCGRETLLGLRKINPEVKVLLSSGFSEEDGDFDVLADGACGFVQKPYGINELIVRVRAVAAFKSEHQA